MSLFVDNTRRGAGELLADLASCRQFRHLTDEQRQAALKETFTLLAELWMGREAVKHPNFGNPCTACGGPRSKHRTNPGLCFKCYAVKGIQERDLWAEDVFETAVGLYGVKCDACGDVYHARIEQEKRVIADRILDNLGGQVKPILCQDCGGDFKSFCSRNYGQGSWRTGHPRQVERMALAWFAQKVKVLAESPAFRKRQV